MVKNLLARLSADKWANTLAIGAASLIPLIGLVGGGVDASRMYLTKSRLQQACDSATLAARKKLGANSVSGSELPADVRTTANNFFRANFSEGMYGSEDVAFAVEAGSATRVDGTASASVPTTLMTVFGMNEVNLDVACSAELNLPNIDVMLVLDTSGSMATSTGTMTRMRALKNAVFAFYDEVMAVKPEDAQLRIGIVPYNSAVNVGGLLVAKNPDYIADSHVYQAREAQFDLNDDAVALGDLLHEETNVELLPTDADWKLPPDRLGSTDAIHYRWQQAAGPWRFCLQIAGSYDVGNTRWILSSPKWTTNYWPASPTTTFRSACQATVTRQTFAGPDDVRPATTTFRDYRYKPMAMDTSQFKLGVAVPTATGTGGALVNSTWNGCIEEREPIIPTSGFTPVPGAFDLDIDLIPDPSDPDTQWKAQWPQISYLRAGAAEEVDTADRTPIPHDCPQAAVRLQEWPLNGSSRNAAFTTYVNALAAKGGTVHDSGMIWAARLISPTGLFAEDNDAAPNGEPISRHIIFMTDGYVEPPVGYYSTFGIYNQDGRFFGFHPSGWIMSRLRPYHLERLAAICEDVKNRNITVWTITLGLPQNPYTRACATGSQRAFETSTAADLASAFRSIASSIAELRLVQ